MLLLIEWLFLSADIFSPKFLLYMRGFHWTRNQLFLSLRRSRFFLVTQRYCWEGAWRDEIKTAAGETKSFFFERLLLHVPVIHLALRNIFQALCTSSPC